jgi:hypothetical protein
MGFEQVDALLPGQLNKENNHSNFKQPTPVVVQGSKVPQVVTISQYTPTVQI